MRRILFDRGGNPALYITGAGVVYTLANQPLGIVQDDRVVNLLGTVCAWFDGAFMWDTRGAVAGFVKGAKPATPEFVLPPTKPLRVKLEPTPGFLHPLLRPAQKPAFRWEWSDEPLETLLGHTYA